VTATYSVGTTDSGTLLVNAYGGGYADAGSYFIPIIAFDAVVTGGGTEPTRVPNTGGYAATFIVENQGTEAQTYSFTCTGSANVTCVALGPKSVTLAPGYRAAVTAGYSVGAAGTGTISVTAATGPFSASGSYTVPVGQAAGAPIVDMSPYNYGKQDYTQCAVGCFATVYAQSTVPYFSLDAPRSVTLAYNSDRVNPRPFVHVNVTPDLSYGQTPTEYRLQVKVNGVFKPFVNGDTLLRFAYPGSSKVRLGGQFDASSYATGVYPVDIVVTALYPGGPISTSVPTKLIVVNETNSAIAGGWTLAGIQRLYTDREGHALVAEGDGGYVYFWNVGGTFVSPAGEFSKLVPSSLSGTNGWGRIYPDSSKAVFDNTGKLVQLRDRFNNITAIAYDGSGRVVRIKDPANLADTIIYGTNGLASIKDPGTPARTTAVSVDASRRLTAITDPDNVSTRFSFDATLLLVQVIDRRGDTTQFGYDTPYQSRKLTRITYPKVPIFGVGTASPTEAHYPWQTVGVPTASTATTPATAPVADTVRARIIDARGYATSFRVDRFGAVTRIDDAAGRTTTFTRDTNSLVVRDSSPSGHVVRRTWSGPNLTQVWDSTTGRIINYTYESTWNQLKQGSGDADALQNFWSGGHLDSAAAGTGALRRVSKYTYDALGRVVIATDPHGHADTIYYDRTPWRNTDSARASGRRTAYTYDGYGRLSTTKTPRGDVTTFAYDVLNRRVSVIGPMADTTVYSYDSLFMRQVRDAVGQTYQFAYTALGWVVSRTDPAGRQDQYQYDQNGNLRQSTNRRGQVISHGAYDPLNRPTSLTADARTTTFAYDPGDRFTAVSNNESTDTIKVDVAGRVQSQISVRAGTRYELLSTSNRRDLRDTLRMASPWADTMAYHYNASMALDTLRDLAGGRTAFVYEQHLLDSAVVLPNGLTITRQWPPPHKPAQIVYSDAAVSAAIGADYVYDTLGLVQDRKRDGAAADSGQDYTYDALARVTRYGDYYWGWRCCPWDPTCQRRECRTKIYKTQESYTYDRVGNRTDLSALVSTGNRLVRFNGDSLVYDADGNLITRIRSGAPIQQLYWSSLGQLDSAWTSGVGTVSLGYDGLGRRVRKTVASTTTRYIHDGDNLFAEVDGGAPTTPLAEYTYYGGVDQPHSVRRRMRSDSVFYYTQEFPGNVTGLVNGARALVNQYRYKPFGVDYQGFPQGAMPNAFRFAGREFDTETGLYYMRARYYDPQVARFISEDPLGLAGGINGYLYAGNNPVNGRDPSGMCGWYVQYWEVSTPSGTSSGMDTYFNSSGCQPGEEICALMNLGSGTCGAVLADGYPHGDWRTSSGQAPLQPTFAQQGPSSPERTVGQCFKESTAPLRGAAAQVAGATAAAVSTAFAVAGRLAMASGTQQVMAGTVSLDIFFGVPGASSSLIEGGIATILAGQATVRVGAGLARVGGYALGAMGTFAVTYSATTLAVCAVNPQY